jgi:hypothetical protein
MQHYIVELNYIIETLKRFVNDYQELCIDTPANVNSAIWIAGHAAFSLYDMIVRPLAPSYEFTANYITLFGTGSPRQIETEYPSYQEVLGKLDQLHKEVVRLIKSQDLDKIVLPKDLIEEGFFSIGNLITHTIQDIAYHNGQLSYLIKIVQN